MAHDSHHSAHEVGGHEEKNDFTAAPHAGYYEIPIALGIFFWVLILIIIYTFGLNSHKHGGMSGEGHEGHKTEMSQPSGHH